ncbi:unnamed protein product [Clavelina lepadiformis]|uniref:Uncharacterized protein n=1 Tax=Clavelina lepadiformis TaxID=159417 RepID=A0ABP0FDL2_CLALP
MSITVKHKPVCVCIAKPEACGVERCRELVTRICQIILKDRKAKANDAALKEEFRITALLCT